MMDKEGTVRRRWLISFSSLYGLSYFMYLQQLIGFKIDVGEFFAPFPVIPYDALVPLFRPGVREFFMSPLVVSVLFFGMIFLFYYFACEKYGTLPLKSALVMMPINAMRIFGDTMKAGFNVSNTAVLLIYFFVFMLPFWISCYQLYRVNKAKTS